MRCFVAIKPSTEIQSYLSELRLPDEQLKRVKDHHITLKFLGEVEDIKSIKESLEKLSFQPFTLTLDTIGVFPHENYIRVVWVGLQNPSDLQQLQAVIDHSLPGKTEKNFHPHFALGRTRKLKDKKAFMQQLKKIKIQPLSCEINEIILFKSVLTKKGPIYTKIATVEAKD